MKEKVAVEALKQVKKALDKHGVEHWLDYGTLLGAIRDGKLIPWDRDIDLGTWSENVGKIASRCKEFHDKGFERLSTRKDTVLAMRKYEIEVDINFYQLKATNATATWLFVPQPMNYLLWILRVPDENKIGPARYITKALVKVSRILPYSLRMNLWRLISLWHKHIQLVIPSKYFKNLSTMMFYGTEFKVPAETEGYLAYRYGKDWSIPRKNYVYYEEDGAIRH